MADEPPFAPQFRMAKAWAEAVIGMNVAPLDKRGPYKVHKRHIAQRESILKAIFPTDVIPRGRLTHLARLSHIPRTTMETWRPHVRSDPDLRLRLREDGRVTLRLAIMKTRNIK
jgi:hypothetical protein